MKKLLIILALSAAVTAQAQIGAWQTTVKSYPVTVGETYFDITNNTACTFTNAIIRCQGGKDVAIQLTCALSDDGTTDNTITFQASVDGVNWASTGITTAAFVLTPAGTAVATLVTNINVKAVNYLRVLSIANANANTGYITNYTVTAFVK